MNRVLKGLVGLVSLTLATAASADPRPWTFVYDVYAEGKGNIEFEQYVTWSTHKGDESGFDRFAFKEEIEIGVTDYFDLSIYVANWSYEDSAAKKGTSFDSVALQGIVYLSKPSDLIGVALYGEVAVGESANEYALEGKLLLHKDIDAWSFGYNLVLETEIEKSRDEVTGERENEVEGVLEHLFGVAYSVNKNVRVGGELIVESIYADWSDYEKTVVYLGPSLNLIGNGIAGTRSNWWVTVTPTYQLTDHDDEADFVVRMIAGLEF